MPALANLSYIEREQLLTIIQESLRVRRHVDFFLWMNGDLQQYLPNEIVLAGWGDFDFGPVHLDLTSAEPGVRTHRMHQPNVTPFVKRLFARWVENNHSAYVLRSSENGFTLDEDAPDSGLALGLSRMRSAIVHGIKNERGRHDSLYIVFNSKRKLPRETRSVFEVLLPYMDASLRQVPLLRDSAEVEKRSPGAASALSPREAEIMEWVRAGKTNREIAMILDISVFTVKNHLHNIFRKLDVLNRAQAVASMRHDRRGKRHG
jgi:transcriptional regulator EpsA